MMNFAPILSMIPTNYAVYVLARCGCCAMLVAWLPVTPAESWLVGPRRVIGLLGQNYRNAANMLPIVPASAPAVPPAKGE